MRRRFPPPPPTVTDRAGSDVSPTGEMDFTMLDRFLAGECSPDEAERARHWLASHAADARYVDTVRDALPLAAAPAAGNSDDEMAWMRLARATVQVEDTAKHQPRSLRFTVDRSVRSRMWLRAATVVLVAGAGALWLVREPIRPRTATGRAAAPAREYATAPGERAELRLPDGTRVMLAPASRLSVPADFGRIRREVALQGQAYFDAQHDARAPFRVRAGHVVAHDLGTRFDVRAYPRSGEVRVVVDEGKVMLWGGRAGAPARRGPVLGVGDVGRIDSTGAIATARANLAIELAWTRGELRFDDAPLGDVAAELARWYDLDIRLPDPVLRDKRLTLALGTASAAEALEAVALLAGARHDRRGRTVTFRTR